MATSGKDYLLQVNTGTEMSPTWTTVAGQRDVSFTRSQGTIDITSKDSNRWKEFIYGNREWSLELDHLVELADGGFQQLESMYENQEIIQVRIMEEDSGTATGSALLTEFSYDAPEEGEASASATLQGSGALTFA